MKIQNCLILISLILFLSFFQFVHAQDYTISGYVLSNIYYPGNPYYPDHPPLEGVTMTASNGGGTTQTQADGFYSFSLPSGWSGTITPSKDRYRFSPESLSYTNLTGDSTDQNFEGAYLFIISGYVRTLDGPSASSVSYQDCTKPLVGMEIYTEDINGVWHFITQTDSNGFYFYTTRQNSYTWAAVPYFIVFGGCGWAYNCYGLCCRGAYMINEDEQINFWNCSRVFGVVKDTLSDSFIGMNDVIVTAESDDGKSASRITPYVPGWNGCFELYLPYEFSGTITPTKPGWVFDPPCRSYSNLIGRLGDCNFIGTRLPIPDLQCNPASLSVNTTSVKVGETFKFSGVIDNSWVGSTGDDFQVNVYICPNQDQLNFQTSYFAGYFYMDALSAESSSGFNGTFTVPQSALPGTYYAWVSIDPNDVIVELDEMNNQQSCSMPLAVGSSTGITSENTQEITQFKITQNYPNPLNPDTRIEYQLPKTSHVILGIYNLMGQELVRLVDEVKETGVYSMDWDGRDNQGNPLPSSVYVYQIRAGEFTESKKLILSR